MTDIFKRIDEVEWEEHFMKVDGKPVDGKIKWIYTKERDDSPTTVMKILLRKGVTLPDHRHENQPDLIYVLEGKATMFIEGQGEFPLEPGMVVMVPPDTLHAIRDIKEDVYLYNVFAPAIR